MTLYFRIVRSHPLGDADYYTLLASDEGHLRVHTVTLFLKSTQHSKHNIKPVDCFGEDPLRQFYVVIAVLCMLAVMNTGII